MDIESKSEEVLELQINVPIKVAVSKSDFLKYLNFQRTGDSSIMDTEGVMENTGLTIHQVKAIIIYYQHLYRRWSHE